MDGEKNIYMYEIVIRADNRITDKKYTEQLIGGIDDHKNKFGR